MGILAAQCHVVDKGDRVIPIPILYYKPLKILLIDCKLQAELIRCLYHARLSRAGLPTARIQNDRILVEPYNVCAVVSYSSGAAWGLPYTCGSSPNFLHLRHYVDLS